jgi:hypothetical protein
LQLAPAYPSGRDGAAFDDFAAVAHFAQALGESDGIFLKLDSLMAWPPPRYFRGLQRKKAARWAATSSCDHGGRRQRAAVRDLVRERGARSRSSGAT